MHNSAILIVSLIAAALLLAGCESTPQSSSSDDGSSSSMHSEMPIEASEVAMIVHGMGCPLCANNVDKQLLAVPGVEEVNVDMGNGRVTVQLKDHPRPTRKQLAKAIDDSGFTLVRFESP